MLHFRMLHFSVLKPPESFLYLNPDFKDKKTNLLLPKKLFIDFGKTCPWKRPFHPPEKAVKFC
jgi:hypothetical protein